jgi:hypothetical protein
MQPDPKQVQESCKCDSERNPFCPLHGERGAGESGSPLIGQGDRVWVWFCTKDGRAVEVSNIDPEEFSFPGKCRGCGAALSKPHEYVLPTQPSPESGSKDGWSAPDVAIDAAWRAIEDLDGHPSVHRNVVALAVSQALLALRPQPESGSEVERERDEWKAEARARRWKHNDAQQKRRVHQPADELKAANPQPESGSGEEGETGQCSTCGTSVALAGDGTIESHRAPKQLSGVCFGTGMEPAPETLVQCDNHQAQLQRVEEERDEAKAAADRATDREETSANLGIRRTLQRDAERERATQAEARIQEAVEEFERRAKEFESATQGSAPIRTRLEGLIEANRDAALFLRSQSSSEVGDGPALYSPWGRYETNWKGRRRSTPRRGLNFVLRDKEEGR